MIKLHFWENHRKSSNQKYQIQTHVCRSKSTLPIRWFFIQKQARRFQLPFCGVYLCPMRLDRRPFFVACIIDSDIAIFSGSHVFEFDIFKGYLPKDFLERLLLLLLLCTFIPLLEVLVVPPPPPLPSWNEDLLPFVFLAMHKNFPIWSSILVFREENCQLWSFS